MYKSKGMRAISIQQVKDYFILHKYGIKSEIAKETMLSQATVTSILQELVDSHYIERVADCESTGGRKAKRYKICAQYMYFGLLQLTVAKGFVSIKARVVDLEDSIVLSFVEKQQELTLTKLLSVITRMLEAYPFNYLSISIPGIVVDGKVTKSDIEAFEDFPLQESIEQQVQLQVILENDVNTAMIGYIERHTMTSPSIAFVYQPDNHHSGCGLYVNHAILYGTSHFAGELAYLPNGDLKQQIASLQTNPLKLLTKQVISVIAIVNPSHMILFTPCVNREAFEAEIIKHIPTRHLPTFLYIDTMEEYVFTGLQYQCVEKARYKTKERG